MEPEPAKTDNGAEETTIFVAVVEEGVNDAISVMSSSSDDEEVEKDLLRIPPSAKSGSIISEKGSSASSEPPTSIGKKQTSLNFPTEELSELDKKTTLTRMQSLEIGSDHEADDDDLEVSVRTPPSDAFSKCMMLLESSATATTSDCILTQDFENDEMNTTSIDAAYRKAKQVLQREFPPYVTPLAASFIEICLLTLYIFVVTDPDKDEEETTVQVEALDLLWGEILQQVSNIAMSGRPSNLTVTIILNILNTYISFVNVVESSENSTILYVKFSNIQTRVLPLLKKQFSPSIPQEEPNKSVQFLWSQIINTSLRLPHENTTFANSARQTFIDNYSSQEEQQQPQQEHNISLLKQHVHCLFTLACRRKLAHVFFHAHDHLPNTAPTSSTDTYAILNIYHHWNQSEIYTSSIYLLFLNTKYLMHRIASELNLKSDDTSSSATQILWTHTNIVPVFNKIIEELETWLLNSSSSAAADHTHDDRYEKVIAVWYKTFVIPYSSDLGSVTAEEASIICHRIGHFLSSLSASMNRIPTLDKNLSVQYLLHSLTWKNNAICQLSLDNKRSSKTSVFANTTGETVVVASSESSVQKPTLPEANIRAHATATQDDTCDGPKLDPLHILAILVGHSGTMQFLDIVDRSGSHIFLPYTVHAVAFCQDLAETLYLLGLKYEDDFGRAMSCWNGALELLLLRPPPADGDNKSTHLSGLSTNKKLSSCLSLQDELDLYLSDGLKFGDAEVLSNSCCSPRTNRRTSLESMDTNNTGTSCLEHHPNKGNAYPTMWTDADRWVIISQIELHRGMLLFPLDLVKALDCFLHARDYTFRSSSSEGEASIRSLGSENLSVAVHRLEQLSTIYSWIASTNRELGRGQLAIEFFQESINYSKACTEVALSRPWVYSLHTANGLFNMAVTLDDLGMFDQSASKYQEAYSILSTVWTEYCTSPVDGFDTEVGQSVISALGSIQPDIDKSSSTTSASVLGEMLEVWICLGNVNLLLQEQDEAASESSKVYQYKALKCFLNGLTVFLENWCKVAVPDVLSTIQGKHSDKENETRLLADAYGKQLHNVAEFVAKYSRELMTPVGKANGVQSPYAETPLFTNQVARKSLKKAMSVSGTVNSYISTLQDVKLLEERVYRLLERAKEILQIVAPVGETYQRDEVKHLEITEIDISACWLVLSDIDLYLNDAGSALECLRRSYDGKTAAAIESLYYYRRGICYLQMRDYNAASESFVAFLDFVDRIPAVISSLADARWKDACYHLGFSYAQLGLFANSIEFYQHSLRCALSSEREAHKDGQRIDSSIAHIYQELSYVYLLECSMKHDEFSAFSENADSIGEFGGIRSSLSTESVLKYMNDALSFYSASQCSSLDIILSYSTACKEMGILCRILRMWDDSENYFCTSLNMLHQLPGAGECALEIANLSYEMGLLFSLRPNLGMDVLDKNCAIGGNVNLESAEIYLRQALHIYELQALDDQKDLGRKVCLAKTWYHLGRVNVLKERYDKESGTLGSVALEFMNEALSLMRDVYPCAAASIHSASSSSLWDLYTSEFMSQLYHDLGVAYFSFCLYSMALECFSNSEDLRLRIVNSMKIDAMMDSCTIDMTILESSYSKLLPITPSKDLRFWSSVGNIHYMKLAKTLNNMGVVYSKLDQYEKSLLCLNQALEIRTKRRELFWSSNKMSTLEYGSYLLIELDYATALINSGHLHAKMHADEKALACFGEARDVLESLAEARDTYCLLANLYHSIARSHASLGQWEEAKTYFVKSLFIRRHKIKSEIKPESMMIEVDDSLSDNYYRESTTPLPVHDSDEESDSALRLSHTLHQLGIVHENLADYREAMICYEEAWFIRKLHLTRDHVIMAQSLCRIGNLKLLDSCNHEVALKCFQEALRVQRQNLGDYALEVSETYYRMGMIHHVRKEFREARNCYTSALQIYKFNGVGQRGDVREGANGSAVETMMKEVLDAWSNLELAESEDFDGVNVCDWSKLALNPKGCVGKMEEIILHLLNLVDQYLLQPGAENAKQAGMLIMDSVNELYTTAGNPSQSLPPPQAGLISPSPRFVFDLQQQLCMIQD